MPMINVSPADIAKNFPAPEGWYSLKLDKVTSKASKDGDSTNFTFEFLITDCKNAEVEGKRIFHLINTKGLGFAVPMIAAFNGKTVEETERGGLQFDTDKFIGMKVDAKLEHELYEGKKQERLKQWLPYGKSLEAKTDSY